MKFEGMILDWLSQPKLQSSTRNTLDSRLSSRWPGQGKKRGKYNLIQGRNSDNHVSLFCTHEQASETVGDESILAEDLEICKQEFEPGLYLVSTPIGNLGDITLRALKVSFAIGTVSDVYPHVYWLGGYLLWLLCSKNVALMRLLVGLKSRWK